MNRVLIRTVIYSLLIWGVLVFLILRRYWG